LSGDRFAPEGVKNAMGSRNAAEQGGRKVGRSRGVAEQGGRKVGGSRGAAEQGDRISIKGVVQGGSEEQLSKYEDGAEPKMSRYG
jgi:hypothetical protein